MPTGSALACQHIPHVLHVGLPGESFRLQLVRQCLDDRRIDTPLAKRLPVRIQRRLDQMELGELRAIQLRVPIRRLPADQGKVVGKARVTDPVVARNDRALGRQSFRQIRRARTVAESRRIGLVFQHDDKNVLRLGGGGGC